MADKAPEPAKDKRQEIADKIQSSDNILITVNNDPSVDELTTALGLTLLVDDMGKHGTAIASGKIPDALEFLNPDKTFENNVDSLRDFIIALNKDKADHLRYKIEGDFVKVFITPYRTTISENDLEFSRGDYNVDLVVALNVKTNDNLDHALQAHGKILHDATVVDITTDERIGIGDITWSNASASSLAEMAVDLISAFKNEGGADSLVDKSIATAFLTGIVASTDRFSNEKTSASTMAAAAKLMKQGADQQLIVSNLDKFRDVFEEDLKSESDKKGNKPKGGAKKTKKPDNELSINHGDASDDELDAPDESTGGEAKEVEEAEDQPRTSVDNLTPTIDIMAEREAEAAKLAEQRLAEGLAAVNGGAEPQANDVLDDLKNETTVASQDEPAPVESEATAPAATAVESPQDLHGAVSNWERRILPNESGGPSDGSMGMSPDTEEPTVPSVEDSVGLETNSQEQPGQNGYLISQPGAPVSPAPESMPELAEGGRNPFVPPVPPPPAPDFSADALSMPPGVPDIPIAPTMPEPAPVQDQVSTPDPVFSPEPQPVPATQSDVIPAPNNVPEGNVFENNTPVMPDQVYPPSAQNNDIGQFHIPG